MCGLLSKPWTRTLAFDSIRLFFTTGGLSLRNQSHCLSYIQGFTKTHKRVRRRAANITCLKNRFFYNFWIEYWKRGIEVMTFSGIPHHHRVNPREKAVNKVKQRVLFLLLLTFCIIYPGSHFYLLGRRVGWLFTGSAVAVALRYATIFFATSMIRLWFNKAVVLQRLIIHSSRTFLPIRIISQWLCRCCTTSSQLVHSSLRKSFSLMRAKTFLAFLGIKKGIFLSSFFSEPPIDY